jgi:hypothetical protein
MAIEKANVKHFEPLPLGNMQKIIDSIHGIKICENSENEFACFPKGRGNLGFLYEDEPSYRNAKNVTFAYTALHCAVAIYVVFSLLNEGVMDVASQNGIFAAFAMIFINHGLAFILAGAMYHIKSIPRAISTIGTNQPVVYYSS